jgi:hypothetical protein
MRITLKDIEENVKPLGNQLTYDREFIFDLLAAYGRAQGNITRLRNGQLNVADNKDNEIAQKGVVYFKPADVSDDELYTIVDDLKTSPTVVRYSTRFVIATNYQKLLAIDTKTGEPLDIAIREIDRHYTYFLPWAGMEKAQFIAENHADVKAAEKMAKLFDILIAHNRYTTPADWHNLTTFFTRLLFCFFAEDTGIFQKNQFINAIASYTQENGSDMHEFLLVLFEALDDEDKTGYPAYLAAFPYVNGKLFDKGSVQIPKFNKEARDLLIESSSKLDWSNINPDIFGSMFQAVVRPGERTDLGQHYTSVPNIMKTIEPLFLDELKEGFDKAYDDSKKLEQLLGRVSNIKVFDPACGSGNFLIIAYKELRKLEHAILERQSELTGHAQQVMFGSRIHIDNFFGIEIDDFAHEVAILSLWLAKHQMNMEFAEKFGIELPLIPLKEAGNIVHANAAQIEWQSICPNIGNEEIYLISNPPYLGASRQKPYQKADMKKACVDLPGYKKLDYIAIWFNKGAKYIENSLAKLAFVSTNSICQGEQVALLWRDIFEREIEIGFTHTSFRWTNNAKNAAGVTCVIIGLKHKSSSEKRIYTGTIFKSVPHINAYLAEGSDIIIGKRSHPISNTPNMVRGNIPYDDGNLLLGSIEFRDMVKEQPETKQYIKRYGGAAEMLTGEWRYCLWLGGVDLDSVLRDFPVMGERVEKVRVFRTKSETNSVHSKRNTPALFGDIRQPASGHYLMFPRISSERREYLPISYLNADTIMADSCYGVPNAKFYLFGVFSSRMHIVWMRAVAGQLETRIRYSSAIVYNNFPVPPLREDEKKEIEEKVLVVLDARESHPEKTLAELYDPDKMPEDLRLAHRELDEEVDKIYRKKPFENDEERLAYLFDLYETMTAKEG